MIPLRTNQQHERGIPAERCGWKYGLLAYAGATYVAASRVADRQHFPSDVIFGGAIGLAAAHTLDRGQTRRLQIVAAPLAKGAMLSGTFRLTSR